MMQLHFIAIGGSAMHSLALAMHRMGHKITGSDDFIFNPSKTNLELAGLLPQNLGWYPEKLNSKIDVVILGMHASSDNPELIHAQSLGLKIQSYPQFLKAMCLEKSTVVIAGSHGKTSITAMILHVLNYHKVATDYMVGATVPAVPETLSLSNENDFVLLEGDEYLSSAIDSKPKFLWYKPEIALISGIAWDHVNVFPTFEDYISQFEKFIFSIVEGGVLIYNDQDLILKSLVENCNHPIKKIPYQIPKHTIENGTTFLNNSEGIFPLSVFGSHNLMNISGAQWIAQLMGVDASDFYEAIPSFTGAAKRLEQIAKGKTSILFKDFAHSPSKVKASNEAVKKQFSNHKIEVCLELHTYSSLDKNFIEEYKDTLNCSDEATIFYDLEALKIKDKVPIDHDIIKKAFNHKSLNIINEATTLQEKLLNQDYSKRVLVMMSSGSFGDLDWEKLKQVVTIS